MLNKSLRIACAIVVATTALIAIPVAQVQSQGPVAIDSGQISGALTGPNHDISVYKGIPYVAPPVGDLRWREPQPAAKWTGLREVTTFSPIPPQRTSPQPQNENSLHL